MKIIVFGAAGQVGSVCASALQKKGYDLILMTRRDVDFADVETVASVVLCHQPDVVINACAYTAVDKAETEAVLADKVNHLSVASMAEACQQIDALLIHLSTDYVFDGKSHTPYDELSAVNPLAVYGKTKLLGEQAIVRLMDKFLVLRTSWVFGEAGNNFVKTMLRLAKERDELSVVSDQIGCPTYAGHIVEVIIALLESYEYNENIPWGVYHCSDNEPVSWYEFARCIFERAFQLGVLSQLPTLHAIGSESYPTPAPRPKFSVLNTQKLAMLLGRPMPSWRQGLDQFLSHQC
jgi:dTDP-4-dehydrorhamnose reductase